MNAEEDPWVCEKCGQRLVGPASLCNSGIHVGPHDGEEAQGEAVRLSDSKFDEVVDPYELERKLKPMNCSTCKDTGFANSMDLGKLPCHCKAGQAALARIRELQKFPPAPRPPKP